MIATGDRVGLRITQSQRQEHTARMRDGECSNPNGCWQEICYMVRQFSNGRYLIENRAGFVRACDEGELLSLLTTHITG